MASSVGQCPHLELTVILSDVINPYWTSVAAFHLATHVLKPMYSRYQADMVRADGLHNWRLCTMLVYLDHTHQTHTWICCYATHKVHAKCHAVAPRHDCTRMLDAAAFKVGTPYTSTAKNPYSDIPTTSQDILMQACHTLTWTMRTVFVALLTSLTRYPSLQQP
jgi:hypothetical protein